MARRRELDPASAGVNLKQNLSYVEGFAGHQTFRRNRVASDDFVYGGASSVGFKALTNLWFEINVEGGNFAAGLTSGFNYLAVAPRSIFRL